MLKYLKFVWNSIKILMLSLLLKVNWKVKEIYHHLIFFLEKYFNNYWFFKLKDSTTQKSSAIKATIKLDIDKSSAFKWGWTAEGQRLHVNAEQSKTPCVLGQRLIACYSVKFCLRTNTMFVFLPEWPCSAWLLNILAINFSQPVLTSVDFIVETNITVQPCVC